MRNCEDTTSEEQLLTLMGQDDKRAFDEIYSYYWDKLFVYVVKIIKDEDEAYDIIQDVFVSLWLKRHTLKLVSLKAYLFTAVRFKTLDHLNKAKRTVVLEESHEALPGQDAHLEHYLANELSSQIQDKICELPGKMREIFILSRSEELSHRQISIKLSISDKTVKKQISNALRLLRFKLDL